MVAFPSGNAAFALAGLLLASLPILMHFVWRRRHQTVSWAAMDFLREALAQRRQSLQLRDALLLALRTACIALFGLAMARPYLSAGRIPGSNNNPIETVLIVDNSLSMNYIQSNERLFDRARAKARDYVRQLPRHSRVTVIPLASPDDPRFQPYSSTVDEAFEALDRLTVVDRPADISGAIDALEKPAIPGEAGDSKRIVLISDQQQYNFSDPSVVERLARCGDVQVLCLAAEEAANTWVSDVYVRDVVATLGATTYLTAVFQYEGPSVRRGVQVSLAIDGVPVDAQVVDLVPGQSREIEFACRFDSTTGNEPFVAAEIAVTHDRLSADDRFALMLPVLSEMRAVFVDQLGGEEDPDAGRYGETYRLRRLLTIDRTEGRSLIDPRHVRIDDLNAQLLEGVPLVVIAGIRSPGHAIGLLRDYVDNGGTLLVACGGDFDPQVWNEIAWRDGQGVLPAPLESELLGVRLDSSDQPPAVFRLDPSSLTHPMFRFPSVPAQALVEIYREPQFFRAAAVDLAGDDSSPKASVLARFDNGRPCVVERNIGRGRSIFFASGLMSDWNSLSMTSGVIVFDRLVRSILEQRLQKRNFSISDAISVSLDCDQTGERFWLASPDGRRRPMRVERRDGVRCELRCDPVSRRGIYRIEREEGGVATIAVQGPAKESDLASFDRQHWIDRFGNARIAWLDLNDLIGSAGAGGTHAGLWQWLLAAVIAGLAAEMLVLAVPSCGGEEP
jgi:hypothetical protein